MANMELLKSLVLKLEKAISGIVMDEGMENCDDIDCEECPIQPYCDAFWITKGITVGEY